MNQEELQPQETAEVGYPVDLTEEEFWQRLLAGAVTDAIMKWMEK